jgi:hypothetical protein
MLVGSRGWLFVAGCWLLVEGEGPAGRLGLCVVFGYPPPGGGVVVLSGFFAITCQNLLLQIFDSTRVIGKYNILLVFPTEIVLAGPA